MWRKTLYILQLFFYNNYFQVRNYNPLSSICKFIRIKKNYLLISWQNFPTVQTIFAHLQLNIISNMGFCIATCFAAEPKKTVIYTKSFLEVSWWTRGKLYYIFFSSWHSNSLKYCVLKRLLTFSWGSLLLLPAGFFNSLKIFYLLRTLLHPLNTQGTVLTRWSDTAELKGLQKLPVKLPNHCTISWECNKDSLRAVGIGSAATAKGWSFSRQQPSDKRKKLHRVLQGQWHQMKERRGKYNLQVKSLQYLLQQHLMSTHTIWEAVLVMNPSRC